jgi:hypothetical protein
MGFQFYEGFAIFMFWCRVPMWTFAIFYMDVQFSYGFAILIWVCNFNMGLQF